MPECRRPSLRADDTGATAIEYSLITGLIAMVIIAGLALIGTGLDGIFNSIVAAF